MKNGEGAIGESTRLKNRWKTGGIAALTAMLLIASPALPANAEPEDPAAGTPSATVEEQPAEQTPEQSESDESGAPAEESEEAQPAPDQLEESAEDPAVQPQTPEARGLAEPSEPTGEAAVADRTISGKVTFPAGTTLAQKNTFTVYVSKPGQRGSLYKKNASTNPNDYQTEFTGYKPTATSAEETVSWSIPKLERTKYNIWIDFRGESYSSAPLALGLKAWNNGIGGDNAPVDLTNGNAMGDTLDAEIGSISVRLVSPYTEAGRYKLNLVDPTTNAVIAEVTNSVYAGDASASYPLRIHDFNAKPRAYKLRADLPNGVKIYADGTPIGTPDFSKATTFKPKLMQRSNLGTIDLREFTDVPKSHKFYKHITWMAKEGITSGVNQPDQTVKYLPAADVTRGAMVAFLYRIEAPKGYTPKGKSPFLDVQPGSKFYTQIRWAYDNGIAAGVKGSDGKLRFMPGSSVNRGSMAAFISRMYRDEIPANGKATTFTDVPKSHRFYGPIKWMSQSGVGAGVQQPNGGFKYLPGDSTTRGAMSAFLYRAEHK